MVLTASPSRRLGVEASFQSRRLARQAFSGYGVASSRKASPRRRTWRGGRRTSEKQRRAGEKGHGAMRARGKGQGAGARGKSRRLYPRAGAPNPAASQNREEEREERGEKRAAAAPGFRRRAACRSFLCRFERPAAAPQPLTSAPPI